MAAADGSIIIDVRANTQQATSALTKLAKLAATAFAVDKIIDFSKQAIQLGSDVAEVQNVVDVALAICPAPLTSLPKTPSPTSA